MGLFHKWVQIAPIASAYTFVCEHVTCLNIQVSQKFQVCQVHMKQYWRREETWFYKWLQKKWAGGRPPAVTETTAYDFANKAPENHYKGRYIK